VNVLRGENKMRKNRFVWISALAAFLALASVPAPAPAQAGGPNAVVPPSLFDGLRFRPLPFARGGRSTAVAGVAGDKLTYYFGSTGGGVWKTTDAGLTWTIVSDGFFQAGSIGAVTVAPSDPNVVYVGTGSACPRGNISPGVGLYRSVDAGATWSFIGLPESGQVGRIAVHPQNPDLVYVAALGHVFGPNDERGVFRSKDGGRTWEKVLYASPKTGAVEVALDPTNPRILYAALWTVRRSPWTIDSGSEESGLFKSVDGGDTWAKLAGGLPAGVVGKISVAPSPARSGRVWALVEAPENRGGLYLSNDGGASWAKTNGERRFLQRAWYYIHAYADPKNPETVYVLNTGFYKSQDGGRTFQAIAVPHGDNHDLWINPDDPQTMINANDGGANVSFTGGRSWTGQMNQPTAEIYRVTADTRFPYWVYGAQQDNSTAAVPSRGEGFTEVGGGESGHIAVDPRNPDLVYAGSYGGAITRLDLKTRLVRSVMVYPELATGLRAADLTYRFQWNAPIRLSPHDPEALYHCSQFVHRSRDGGLSWEVVSPDLTRNDKSRQDYSGRPITHDSTGVEVFGTIFAFEESPLQAGLLWAGSDDGLVHLSRDNAKTWTNVTPPGLQADSTVNMIDPSAHDPGRAFLAVHRYRLDDFRPMVYRTNDYGKTWDLLTSGTNGIPARQFVRVVREDPGRRGLLYAGTEFGLYASFDDGSHWQPFQLNLPVTPVMDLMVHRADLIVATQGRSFWVLDDLSPLHELGGAAASKPFLFAPRPAIRAPEFGAEVNFFLPDSPREAVTLEIADAGGVVVRSFRAVPAGEAAGAPSEPSPRGGDQRLRPRPGLNRVVWNFAHDPLFTIPPGTVLWGGGGGDPKAVPGSYQVRLKIGDWSQAQPLEVKPDPRNPAKIEDFRAQNELARAVGEKIRTIYDRLLEMRDVRRQAQDVAQRLERGGFGQEAAVAFKTMDGALTKIEGELTQLKGEGGQDALNFPGRHDNQWVKLYGEIASGDGPPTAGARRRYADLLPEYERLMAESQAVLERELDAFNKLVRDKGAPAVIRIKRAALN
jgi:photosystem II stability/assembly factor-like uncharacterized protein